MLPSPLSTLPLLPTHSRDSRFPNTMQRSMENETPTFVTQYARCSKLRSFLRCNYGPNKASCFLTRGMCARHVALLVGQNERMTPFPLLGI